MTVAAVCYHIIAAPRNPPSRRLRKLSQSRCHVPKQLFAEWREILRAGTGSAESDVPDAPNTSRAERTIPKRNPRFPIRRESTEKYFLLFELGVQPVTRDPSM